ncbi:MAG: RICIN domain-containing protein [Eubacteriales bacterium]|nr:RICIN domain-containing protein [Eubacteriales bacterium]
MNILVADKNDPEKIEYRFLSLYAYDSYDPANETEQRDSDFRHLNEELYYELTDNGDGAYTITVVVPEEYLTHPETVYPVTVDPTVTLVSNNSNAHDTFVNAATPNTQNNSGLDYIRFGKVNGYKNFGYHRFTSLPSLPSGSIITSSYLKFTFRSGQTTPTASSGISMWTLHVTNHQWYESTITWNNQPFGSSGPITPITYNGSYLNYFNANITSMVQAWYNGTPNYGIDFTYSNEEHNDYNSVVSSEGEAHRAPVLTINYLGGTAPGIDNNQIYYIRSVHSGKYLDVSKASGNVSQWAFHGYANQQWKVVSQSDGTYKLYTMALEHNGKCLDIESLTTNNVDVYSDGSGDWIRWVIDRNSDGTYRLFNKWGGNSTKVMEVTGPSTDNGANVIQYNWHGGNNQRWVFEPLETKLSQVTGKTFSAFNVGDSNLGEDKMVAAQLKLFGYQDIGTYENNVTAARIKQLGRYSDIIYINGHGDGAASLAIQHTLGGSWSEYLSAAAGMNNEYYPSIPKTIIGANFLSGSTTITDSFWNIKTKWGIFGQCSQLNYGSQGLGNHWNGINNAQIWARTMLGNGHRSHGVLGYYGSAPGGEVHMDRLAKSLNSMNVGFNLVTSWFQGHDAISGRTNYAMLYNNANYNDTVYNFTASQTPGTSYAMTLQRREGGTVVPVPLSNPPTPQNPNIVNFTQSLVMNGFELQDRLLSQSQKATIESMLSTSHFNKLSYNDDGSFEFKRESGNRLEVTFNEDIAIEMAKRELNSAGLLPDNNYRISVDYLVQRTLTSANPDFSDPVIIQYNVYFYRTINGYDILSDKDDGILISIDNDGIVQMKYRWRDVVPKSTTYNISSSALTNCKNEYSETCSIKEKIISSAYYYKDGNAMPIMVFDDDGDYTNSVFIDVFTGKVVG